MAVVGPSGSGKRELIFKLLTGRLFYPKFERVLFFYKDIQPVVMDELNARRIHIEFVKFDGFDRLRNIENILLVFDDSCEEIYNDKEFVKLATAGRHRGLDVIYVKHNLFQQSRWSRTIDLNTSHIILFNHLVIFSNLITSEGNLMYLNSYVNRMNWLKKTASDIY